MTDKEHPRETALPQGVAQIPKKKKIIPARDVGVTLTISRGALEEVDRIREETMQAARENREFLWR